MLSIGSLSLRQPTLLAPMASLTDRVFRTLIDEIGGCGLMVSEMISAEGLRRRNRRTVEMLGDFPSRTPQFIQLFGHDPAALAEAAAIIEGETGFSGIDLNMGCPVPKVVRQGAGAGLLQSTSRATALVRAVRAAVRLPLSVKIRLGYSRINVLELAPAIQEAGADALTVHFRLARDSFTHPARWEWAGRVREALSIPLFGNGDLDSSREAAERLEQVDGVAIGRGALHNPFIFAEIAGDARASDRLPSLAARLCELIELHLPVRLRATKLKAFLRYLSFGGRISRSQKRGVFLSEDFPSAREAFLELAARTASPGGIHG